MTSRHVPADWNGGSGIYVNHYGCVKCQKRHFEDEDIYHEHIYWQSKHGIDSMPIEQRMEIAAYFETEDQR